MNILACTDYYTPHIGGVEIAASHLYRELAERGHNITIMTLGSGQANHKNITVKTASKIEVTKYIGLQSSLSVDFPKQLLWTFRNNEYDLIHIHNRFFYTSTLVALLSPTFDIPLVFSLHTSHIDMYSGLSGILARQYEEFVCSKTLKNADYIICNSKSTAQKARSLGANSNHISTQYHGVDTDQFSPREVSETGTLRLIYVGRLVKNKGPLLLVKIFKRVKQAVPDARLEIVGEGPLEGTIRSKLSQDNVTFHGSVPHEEIAELYKKSHIFCLPSKSEGLSLTTLEAMATGLPVVVSDTGGLREIVKNGVNGHKIPSTNIEDFSDTIIGLWRNPSRRERVGNNAREYILENHNWKDRAENIESIFRQLVEG